MKILIFLLVISSVFSSSLIPQFDSESTSALLRNLNDYEKGLENSNKLKKLKLVFFESCTFQKGTKKRLFSINDILPDKAFVIIFEYLDYFDGKSFMETCKDFYYAAKLYILKYLHDFSEHFIFEEDWLNHAMICHLSSIFPSGTKSNDPNIYDIYASYQLKRFSSYDNEYTEVLPLYISYKLQSFLHEFLYGSQDLMPENEHQWNISFLNKISNNNYENTIKLYVNIAGEIASNVFESEEAKEKATMFLNLFIDLYKGPLTNEKFLKCSNSIFNLNLGPKYLLIPFVEDFIILNDVHFHQILVPDEMMDSTFKEIVSKNLFSKSFYDRFPADSTISLKLMNNGKYLKNRLIFEELGKLDGEIPEILRKLVREPNQLDISIEEITPSFLHIIGNVSNPDLYLIELFTRALKANVNELDKIEKSVNSLILSLYSNGHPIFFYTLLKESCTPINFFIIPEKIKIIHNCFNIIFMAEDKFEKFEMYLNYLLKRPELNRNPLPLLFIDPRLLKLSKELIRDKYNLHYRYNIDFDVNLFGDNPMEHLLNLKSFEGQTLTFKQIIDILEVDSLIDVFTSDSSNLGLANYIESEKLSILKFIMTGKC